MSLGSMMGKKAYSRRYFALSGTTLSYFREIESDTPAGAVKLEVSASGLWATALRLLVLSHLECLLTQLLLCLC